MVALSKEQWKRGGDLQISAKVEWESSPLGFLQRKLASEAINGDPEILRSESARLFRALVSDGLTDADKWLVGAILIRIADDSSVAHVVSGGAKSRGAPKRGMKAFGVAISVVYAILEGGATTIGQAQQMVADAHHLEAGTVKRYWSQWKAVIKGAMVQAEGEDPMETWLENNRGGV